MTRYSASRREKDVSGRHDNGGSWATCGGCGKRTYPSKKAARAAQRNIRAANERDGVHPISVGAVNRPYPACGVGGGFHLGHETGKGRPNLNDARLTFLDPAGPADQGESAVAS